MTINISYVRDDISIILSDRRLSRGLKGEQGYSDNNTKLINLENMGWVTGAGLYNFIEPFNEAFAKMDIEHTDQIIDLFQDIITQKMEEFPEYKERMLSSSIFFSFIGPKWEGTGLHCKVAKIDKVLADNRSLHFFQEGEVRVIAPSDFNKDLCNLDVNRKYQNENLDLRKKSLHDVVIYLLEVFKELSRDTKFASKECDIGIYRLNNREISKLKLSGDVSNLLNKLEKSSIENHLEVIEKRVLLL
ncbi:hypothetical protein KXS12_16170 [Priestia filamentosa]|uniref:hypothetical protein n=1 Tax=Priestia filamentosa TaxID=1402861 RepID=UPI003F13CD49